MTTILVTGGTGFLGRALECHQFPTRRGAERVLARPLSAPGRLPAQRR